MTRFSCRLSALLLATFALAGCSMMGMGDLSSEKKDKDIAAAIKDKAPSPKAAAADIDGNLRQATLLRQAGDYDAAIRIVSQLMLVDPDNPRVAAEYGKALAQKGRAQEAIQFLRRAIELSSSDWTLYSALGTSYDQIDDHDNARLAYEHALALKPGEPSVLNNYAFSRMMAKDPDGARLLMAQAQAAGGADAKIGRNVALIAGMAPEKTAADTAAEKPTVTASAVKSVLEAGTPAEPKTAAAAPAPKVAQTRPAPAPARVAVAAPVIAPPIPVMETPAPQAAAQSPQTSGDVSKLLASQGPVMTATTEPRQLTPQLAAQTQVAAQAPIVPSGVVMQAVPYDPYAGPVVKLKPQPKTAAKPAHKNDTAKADTGKADTGNATDAPKADKAGASKTDAKANAPQKAAATKSDVVPSLRVAADKY